MRLGTVTSAPAVRTSSRIDGATSITPVRRINADWPEEDPLDELTQSDRALLGHLYAADDSSADDSTGSGGASSDAALKGAAPVAALAREINRERTMGMVSDQRDLTAEDLRRILGRLTVTSREPVPVAVQASLMAMLTTSSEGRLDVVL